MKIIALADIHLDISNRFEDFLNSLNQVKDYAVKNKADKVIVLGDVYQRRRPYSVEKYEFDKWVKVLVDNGIEVIIIPGLKGMHDLEHDVSTVSEFEALKIKGVSVLPNKSVIDVNDSFKMFIGHLMLREVKMGALEYGVSDDAIGVKELMRKYPADIYLLGHVHRAQQICKKPPVLYAGSIDRVTFGEKDEVKGFIDINVSATLKYKFVPLKTRKMIRLHVDNQWLSLGKPRFEVNDCIVEVIVTCRRDEIGLFKDSEIRDALKEAKIVKDISFELEDTEKPKNDKINSRISPIEAFMEYAKQEELSEEVVSLGEQIIKGEST